MPRRVLAAWCFLLACGLVALGCGEASSDAPDAGVSSDAGDVDAGQAPDGLQESEQVYRLVSAALQ